MIFSLVKTVLMSKALSFFLAFICLSGCVKTHYDRSENFQFSWKIGDYKSAAEEAESLSLNGPKKDRLLHKLEEGSVKRLVGDLNGSVSAFTQASNEYYRWFGAHLQTETKISEEFFSVLGSAESKPYKSRVYERVMLRLYQALNYLQLGEKARARAQIFKSRQAIEDSREIWKKELSVAREAMSKKGINLAGGVEAEETNPLREEFNKIKSMVPPNFPEFVNPAAVYLEALYFLRTGTQREDFEKAFFSLRQLVSLFPENQWIRDDFEQSKNPSTQKLSSTYVFFETGRAPVRIEKRFDLPIIFFANQSRIPYLGIALPTIKTNDMFMPFLTIRASNQNKPVRTKVIADLDAIVAKEFEKNYPVELSRAISGAMVKGGLQYLATDSVRSENDTTRVLVGVAAGLLAQMTTRADLRAWTTLPKQIQFAKIDTPEDKKLTLSNDGATFVEEVILKPSTTNLVWVRSISTHTPLQVVGIIPLDQ